MKVLQINAVFGALSTGVIVKDIDELLRKNGKKSIVAFQKSFSVPSNGFVVGNKADWLWHAVYTRVFGRQAYASKFATKKLLRWIDKEKPDVVHLHNLHSNYINLNLLLNYLHKKGIAVVVTLHDCWFFTGKCFHFDFYKCNKWMSGCGDCPQNKAAVKSLFFDRTKCVLKDKRKFFQAIEKLVVVGCSDWICNLARESAVFSGKDIRRIYNGVDLDIFYQRDRELLKRKYGVENSFVTLGMANKWFLSQNKEILENWLEQLGEKNKLIVVGCNTEQKEYLSKNKNVIPIGFVRERNELAEIYSTADVFVNLTFEDTLPTVNMEAICCGTPVVTYDSCGSPELIKENETGYVIPQLDFEELKNAVSKVKDGCISREDCQNYGRVHFDKEKNLKQYMDLFEELAGS